MRKVEANALLKLYHVLCRKSTSLKKPFKLRLLSNQFPGVSARIVVVDLERIANCRNADLPAHPFHDGFGAEMMVAGH